MVMTLNLHKSLKRKRQVIPIRDFEMKAYNSGKEGMIEIVFFDLETNVPSRAGQRFWVLEFGAIVVCPQKLVELESYSTLIRPKDMSVVSLKSGRCDVITRAAVANAQSFEQVADKIFSILNGRVWAGHNIQRFDCIRIKEAFADIGRPAPEPVGMIDSLGILTEKFGRRSGNMKMASLATYFGLGQQKHRSLDDVRMNLEVLKHCATVLFLESSLPNILNGKWQGSPTIMTRSRTNGKLQCREEASQKSPQISSIGYQKSVPYTRGSLRKREYEICCVKLKENKPLTAYSSILTRCYVESDDQGILYTYHAMEDDEVKYIKESSSLFECTSEDAEIIKKMHYKNTNQFVYP